MSPGRSEPAPVHLRNQGAGAQYELPLLPSVIQNSAPVTATNSSGEFLAATPALSFTKVESFGYSLNGEEFQVPEGQSYSAVTDSFEGTSAKILGGTNSSTATDLAGRKPTETVDTGWSRDTWRDDLKSNVLTLWGMTDLGAAKTGTYTLSMSYGHFRGRCLPAPGYGTLVTRDARGRWVNAVDLNTGGVKKFVFGPWKASYGLGTCGVDTHTRTAWAVINHEGTFAVAGS